MVLSNVEIIKGIEDGYFSISPLAGNNPALPPFNTTSVDLRLSEKLFMPIKGQPITIDLADGGSVSDYLVNNTEEIIITKDQPLKLKKGMFVIGSTIEKVHFPIGKDKHYCARVEGKSSIARCGIIIHCTAPTIHTRFNGTIALEITNVGETTFLLSPNQSICQLIIEQVVGVPVVTANQFIGQLNGRGIIKQ